jgi:hypothetical protein
LKDARTVLRGGGDGNAASLPDRLVRKQASQAKIASRRDHQNERRS